MCFFLQQGFNFWPKFNKAKILLWAMAFSLLNIGCIAFHPKSLNKDSLGYYTRHYDSCGPVALERAFRLLGETQLDRFSISRDIQDSGNSVRLLMMLVHHDTILVSLPSELKEVANKYGYEMVKTNKSLDELSAEKDVAIVLLFGNVLKSESHWACFPHEKDIKAFFGPDTEISRIYLLKKIRATTARR